MSDPIVRNGSVALTPEELDVLDSMLKAGDRAGFYIAYYSMTGSAQALLQAKIATFSGLTGGAAFAANRFLQDNYSQYPGIYYLSQQVARSAYNAILASATNDGAGLISDDKMLESAALA